MRVVTFIDFQNFNLNPFSSVISTESCSDEQRYQFSIEEQLPRRNVKRFRGGLVFKAHRLLHHSTLGLRVINNKEEKSRGLSSTVRSRTNNLFDRASYITGL